MTFTRNSVETDPYNIEYCSNITSILLFYFHQFREYSLKVKMYVCNPEAILLNTHDFRFSIAFENLILVLSMVAILQQYLYKI